MKHKWLRNFDKQGNWTGSERKIVVGGVEHDLDDYAKKQGVKLPDSKKEINTDIEENHADLEQSFDFGSVEIDRTGDSEGSE